jgi:SAM-dependent methyltransferase
MTTLERISPLRFAPPWVRHQHLARYEWAAELCRGKSVVDAACGTGYGSAMLAREGAGCVQGFDLSPAAIDEARATYADLAQFQAADVAALPLDAASIDVFVSFETIEHLPDEHGLLCEVTRVLRSDGLFLCSSPNRSITNPGTNINDPPFNRHHVREYTPAEFDRLLCGYFARVEWFGQTLFTHHWKQTLAATAAASRPLAVKLHQARKLLASPLDRRTRHRPQPFSRSQHPEFLVALCRQPLTSR